MDFKKYLLCDNEAPSLLITEELSKEDRYSYPKARQSRNATVRGTYAKGYPKGAVIHFTAGNNNVKSYQEYMNKMGYTALLIDRKGQVWQDFSLLNWGYHAGESIWPGCGSSVNDEFVGIELMSAGPLACKDGKWLSLFGSEIPSSEVIHALDQANIKKGVYQAFTPEQMHSLEKLLLWLYKQGKGVFSLDNVVGHDEVSPGRKIDPGACMIQYDKNVVGTAISGIFTMPKYREYLKSQV